jgi:hypothetical protein
MNRPQRAFVLMPFDKEFDVVWDIVRDALEGANYVATRADNDPSQGNVLRDVVNRLLASGCGRGNARAVAGCYQWLRADPH